MCAGVATTFEPLRPYFLGATALLLGGGFALVHRVEKRSRPNPRAEARVEELDVEVNSRDTSSWYSNRRVGEPCAMFKTLVQRESDRIVGAHLLGPTPRSDQSLRLGGTAGVSPPLPSDTSSTPIPRWGRTCLRWCESLDALPSLDVSVKSYNMILRERETS